MIHAPILFYFGGLGGGDGFLVISNLVVVSKAYLMELEMILGLFCEVVLVSLLILICLRGRSSHQLSKRNAEGSSILWAYMARSS